ncbi:hypothetical protein [Flavobacterium sp.]|jgi:hypothetical protein|uniref:hypothetical protein n=1 Tax=Flavobacterium sp. TaxID=239 RepID=UPI0037BEB140
MPTRHFIDRNKTRYTGTTPLEVARKIANNNHKEIFSIRETTRNSYKNIYYYESENTKVRSVTREYKQKIMAKLSSIFESFNDNHYGISQMVVISQKDVLDLKEYLHHKKTKYVINKDNGNGMVVMHKNIILNIIAE